MKIEMERKFLLSEKNKNYITPQFYKLQFGKEEIIEEITQGYLTYKPNYEVRVREILSQGQSKHFLTLKLGNGLKRTECEIEITPIIFTEFWRLIKGKGVKKIRKKVLEKTTGLILEIDTYLDRDLCVVEVESNNIRKLKAFPLIGKDVTGIQKYKNCNLAK